MTDEQLQSLVEEVSLEAFGLPFSHEAFFNNRLKTTGGRYHLNDHHIDFNPAMADLGKEVLIGIIKHELCHYHLHLQKKGYRHKDQEFKQLLKQTNGSRYAPSLPSKNKWHYHCQNCGAQFVRARRINTTRYVCGRCQGKLIQNSI